MAAKYTDTVTNNSGTSIEGATVQLTSGGSVVTLYADDALTQPLGTSAVSDSNGLVEFYVADGTYSVTYTAENITKTLLNVELYDLSTLRADASASTANKANAAAIGITNSANDMGAWTDNILTAGSTAKAAIQALATLMQSRSFEIMTAGANLLPGNLVSIGATVILADNDASVSTKAADGFVLDTIASSATGKIYFPGQVIPGLSGLTAGTRYYLGVAGAVTATAPSASGKLVQEVGIALSTTRMLFSPKMGVLL